MQIFNLVEELEKERKKNKELEEVIDKVKEKIKAIQYNANKYGAEHDVIVCEELLNILEGKNNGL